ncbi:MAG: MBL fold metallo-hydrolase [Betaproteobacteria bacterium]|nr:MBL fold metallo-hydrolase [Betaproteobacteria bacterium]
MRNIPLFDTPGHRFILLNESGSGEEDGIRSNQYLILHENSGVLLDPGGFDVMPRVLAEMLRHIGPDNLKAIMLSHQDPDIVGGISTWIELTDAPIYIPRVWTRFLPHYGIRHLNRFISVADDGMHCEFAPGFELQLVPAHFLHSEGQINVYDPRSKILFSGDIGTAEMPGHMDPVWVDDFTAHLPYIESFHRRYMCSNRAARIWVDTVSALDIAMIAPQHGPVYRGAAVSQFLEWFGKLECGVDLMTASGRFRMGSQG